MKNISKCLVIDFEMVRIRLILHKFIWVAPFFYNSNVKAHIFEISKWVLVHMDFINSLITTNPHSTNDNIVDYLFNMISKWTWMECRIYSK
jgi:hypothetical protein